jgi:hypothetical protein
MLMAKNPSAPSTNGKELKKNLLFKAGMMLGKNSKMNHEHRQVANSILSRLKDGEEFSQSVIRTALTDTGDLAPVGSKGLDQKIQQEIDGGWESGCISMVAASLIRLSEKAWDESRKRLAEAHE